MYTNINRSKFFNSVQRVPKNDASQPCNYSSGGSYNQGFKGSSKRLKKLSISVPLKQSQYKWQNANSRTETMKSILQNNVSSVPTESVLFSHYRSSIPFLSTLSKGWFSRESCNVACTKSSSFDLRSCCFIDNKFLPKNTINENLLTNKNTNTTPKKFKATNMENRNPFVKLSQHKLVRKQDRSNNPKKTDSSLVLSTQRKLIRKVETIPNENQPVHLSAQILETKPSERIHLRPSHQVTEEKKETKKASPSSLVVLTRRKLVRKSNPSITNVPNKLISINRNKLINSCLLRNNTNLAGSVLHQIIKQRRRPYAGSSYVLFTRNKLIRRAKYRQKLWQKQSIDESRNTTKTPSNLKTFVSVGKNKLIRKSLLSKRNKTTTSKTVEKPAPFFRKAILARVLKSPSKRIQRFTNHLSRINLKYSYIRGRSGYSSKTKRFLHKCKNNRRIFKKKSDRMCPNYRRNGICLKHSKKRCIFVHDPKYISLCQKLIKGACESKDCSLSHDLIPQKMTVCVHYLNNSCTNDSCPFLHSKPDVKAPICDQFLLGYCESADRCSNWHVYACPEYKKNSSCARGDNCRLPHRNVDYFENNLVDEKTADDDDSWRYFGKNALNGNDFQGVPVIPGTETIGALPDFIPL